MNDVERSKESEEEDKKICSEIDLKSHESKKSVGRGGGNKGRMQEGF